MGKKKIAVIYGGMSTEHDVSIQSGKSIVANLNKETYDVVEIYIDKSGNWFCNEEKIENVIEYLKTFDVAFPVLHGLYGEDGTIQGLFELIKLPYVGCKVLSSAVAMDKVFANIMFKEAGIKKCKYIYIKNTNDKYRYKENDYTLEEVGSVIEKELGYPNFVKPSNSGSSVGINKSNGLEELKNNIEYVVQFDKKILIEEAVEGREIECAVLGWANPEASVLGEIVPAAEFYSYEAKYADEESKLIIPAELPEELSNQIREIAIKAYKSIDCSGLARVDFFLDKKTGEILLNEINTMPGFTKISMYPKLWENTGVPYSELLQKLIEFELLSSS